jgi:hypothetical protein
VTLAAEVKSISPSAALAMARAERLYSGMEASSARAPTNSRSGASRDPFVLGVEGNETTNKNEKK